jgi:hypothetical protein
MKMNTFYVLAKILLFMVAERRKQPHYQLELKRKSRCDIRIMIQWKLQEHAKQKGH